MAEERNPSIVSTNAETLGAGMNLDATPVEQPKGTSRFILNGVESTREGKVSKISTEQSNTISSEIPTGTETLIPIGKCYFGEDQQLIFLAETSGNISEIGILDRNGLYTTVIRSSVLKFNPRFQIQCEFRVRRNERNFYWVDSGLHDARTFNLDDVQSHYTLAYKTYLAGGGDPNTYPSEKYELATFDLISSTSQIPEFADIEILEYGSVKSGSYNFAIQYVDEDTNATGWLNVSNTVNMFIDTIDLPYKKIRGSRYVQNDAQNFTATNKSIRLTVGNLDPRYPYYRVAIIQSYSGSGEATRALVSDIISVNQLTYIYSGNDADYTQTPIADIILDKEHIYKPDSIEQLENRLLLANTKGQGIDWCNFQGFASSISSMLITKDVILNKVEEDNEDTWANQKNKYSSFLFRGYMPGDVYSFAIVYILKDGSLSPAFHIPGRNALNDNGMAFHELDSNYADIHKCTPTSNYWGTDSTGDNLVNTPVRHHKFKTRRELNKDLFSDTTIITTTTRYKVRAGYQGNALITPTTVFNFVLTYKTNGVLKTKSISFTGEQMVNAPSNYLEFEAYDGTDLPEFVTGSDYVTTTPTPTSPISFNGILPALYITYTAESRNTITNSEILGIQFDNIVKPHADVVGFYIVRNERTDADKIVVDNAYVGQLMENNNFRSFSLIAPQGRSNTLKSEDSVWFFSPEHQFLNKRLNFDSMTSQGFYYPQGYAYGTDNGSTRGRIVQDVQPGTSYNQEYHKKKTADDDGFDLLLGNRTIRYGYENSDPFPIITDILDGRSISNRFYLSAASNRIVGTDVYYNVSCDNKIGITTFNTAFDRDAFDAFTSGANQSIIYATLTNDNRSSYQNFLTRQYYKEHNNPFYFDGDTFDGVRIFNGDAYISPITLTNSLFYETDLADRSKKNRVWTIVLGSILVAAGIVAGVLTAGAGLAITAVGVATLAGAALAVSYGVSLAISGLKFEQMKTMIDEDYANGLKDTIIDTDITSQISGDTEDDTFKWYSERALNLWIESSVPVAMRSGLTGASDFLDSPSQFNTAGIDSYAITEFEDYLTGKFTVLDPEQGSGRLYKGYPTAEIYDINLDYMRFNHQKFYYHLPLEYNCCNDQNENFKNRIYYSEQAFQEERVDNYKVFLPNNYRDIEADYGRIKDIYTRGNSLMIQTLESLYNLPQNNQERVTGEVISFIGTGEFFSIPPRRIVDSENGSCGTQHKWARIKTPEGVFSIDALNGYVSLFQEKLERISNQGMINFFKNNGLFRVVDQVESLGIKFINSDNPASEYGVGFHSGFDARYNRVLLTKKDFALKQEYYENLYGAFVGRFGDTEYYVSGSVLNIGDVVFNTASGNFILITDKIVGIFTTYRIQNIAYTNGEYFENRSFTLSYSLNSKTWVSFHSYLPSMYFFTPNYLYTFDLINRYFWKHNIRNRFLTFYDSIEDHVVELVSLSNGLENKIFEDVTLQTEAVLFEEGEEGYITDDVTFTGVVAYNTNQTTGDQTMVVRGKNSPEDFLFEQITNSNSSIIVARIEKNWNINNLRDVNKDYNKSLFSTKWQDLQGKYFIDKVVNPDAIDMNKDWDSRQPLRDKFLILRFKFSNFDNIQLTTNYILNSETKSFR